jgi:hypothetical protein
MPNYIFTHLSNLKKRHYSLKTPQDSDFWYNARPSKLNSYSRRFGGDFCLVLYRSRDFDDNYIMPFNHIKTALTEETLDKRGRWTGTVRNNVLYVSGRSSRKLDVSAYYNSFEHLAESVNAEEQAQPEIETEADQTVLGRISTTKLKSLIKRFNTEFANASPTKTLSISDRVARPGTISSYLKLLKSFVCQICGEVGFRQANGSRYAETHHIIELHRLIEGSLCSDNIIVVCPTCHKKLHYAKTVYSYVDDRTFEVHINAQKYRVTRNIISD